MRLGRASVVVAALLAACMVALAAGSIAPASPETEERQGLASSPRQLDQFGYVRSLVRKRGRFELRFDPAFWLSGTTANRAAVEDGVIPPGDTVPNDYYIRNEGRRVLTYIVPRTARVTVLTNPGAGPRPTRITVGELAAIVEGRNPRGRPLYDEGNHLGYWARISNDTVTRLDQQYQP